MAELGMPCDRFGYNAILAALARQVRRRAITDMVNAILAALARHVGGGVGRGSWTRVTGRGSAV
jgi:hypothetical protein